MRVELGEYLPDQPDFEAPGLTEAKNVLPAAKSYMPWKSSVAFTDALDARARGGIQVKDKDGNTYIYAGDAAKLYGLEGDSWADYSKAGSPAYALATAERWRFVKWGETVIAVSGVNTAATNNIQTITLGATQFADLSGSPPQARHIGVVRDFVVVGNTWDGTDGLVPNRVRWSGINDETAWTVSAVTQADYQDLQGNGGWVQAVVGGEYGVIFQERTIWRMTYTGSPTIFQFDEVVPNRGTPCPGSVVRVGDMIFYLSQEGFEVLQDGSVSRQIGAEKVDRTFFDDFDATYPDRVVGMADPINRRVFWAYPGVGNTGGRPNKVLCYEWTVGRWTYSEQDLETLLVGATSGTNLDALDALIISSRTELVTNGAFASDTGWTKGTGWTISGGTATHAAGSASELSQDITAVEKTGYYLTFTVSGRTAGSVTANIGDTDGTARSTNATFSETIHAGAGDTLVAFAASSDFDGSIDNVSVKSASIDAMTETLDSRSFMGGAGQSALFDSDNKLAFWSGAALTGVIETTEGELVPEERARIREIRPHVDGGTTTVDIGTRQALADSVTWAGAASPNARGRVTRRSNSRYHRFRLTVSGDYTHVTGLDVILSKGGRR